MLPIVGDDRRETALLQGFGRPLEALPLGRLREVRIGQPGIGKDETHAGLPA
jgi:hypothetical protein